MAANIAEIRRNLKNVAHNYTDAQVKVRAATSNDPWGPSSTQMCEIADLTYNVIAFSEIMQMIWKRVNDSGKNWRHVYKALVLLEYLIKTGSEKVAAQCKENLFSIQTLKDFQFIEENKDQGLNVREKAKSLVSLLKDDEKLKNERVKALKAKERFSQSTAGIGSDTAFVPGGDVIPPNFEHREDYRSELDMARSIRPTTAGEEELQLQLALAMSREEAETEESKAKSDEMRLKLAIEKSKEEQAKEGGPLPDGPLVNQPRGGADALLDLADINFGNPAPPQRTQASMGDPWTQPAPQVDPWGGASAMPTNNLAALATLGAPPGGSSGAAGPPDPWGGIGAAGPSPAAPGVYPNLAALGAPSVGRQPAEDPWNPALPPAGASANPGIGALNDPWGAPPSVPAPKAHSPGPWNNGGGSVSPQPWAVSPSRQPQSTSNNNDLFSQGNNVDILSGLSAGSAPPHPVSPAHMQAPVSPGRMGGGELEPANNPWDLSALDPMGGLMGGVDLLNGGGQGYIGEETGAKPKKSVESLLGEHSNLVNLDSLVKVKPSSTARNPFSEQPNPFQAAVQPNVFQAAAAPKPSMNQLRTSNQQVPTNGNGSEGMDWPGTGQNDVNPFF